MSNPSLSQFIVNHPLMLELQDRLEKEWAEKIQKEHSTQGLAIEQVIQNFEPKEVITGFGPNGPVINNITADSLRIKNSVGSVLGGSVSRKDFEGKAAGSCNAEMKNVREGYSPLANVLAKALDQAQNGKGNQRHQVGSTSFVDQPICSLTRLYGLAYPFGQAAKKVHEVGQLERKEAKLAEVLGAINYLAAAYIVISESK